MDAGHLKCLLIVHSFSSCIHDFKKYFEYLLCARHSTRCSECHVEQNQTHAIILKKLTDVSETDTNQRITDGNVKLQNKGA